MKKEDELSEDHYFYFEAQVRNYARLTDSSLDHAAIMLLRKAGNVISEEINAQQVKKTTEGDKNHDETFACRSFSYTRLSGL